MMRLHLQAGWDMAGMEKRLKTLAIQEVFCRVGAPMKKIFHTDRKAKLSYYRERAPGWMTEDMLLEQMGLRERVALQLKLQGVNRSAYGAWRVVDPVTLRDLATISVTFQLFFFEVLLLASSADTLLATPYTCHLVSNNKTRTPCPSQYKCTLTRPLSRNTQPEPYSGTCYGEHELCKWRAGGNQSLIGSPPLLYCRLCSTTS